VTTFFRLISARRKPDSINLAARFFCDDSISDKSYGGARIVLEKCCRGRRRLGPGGPLVDFAPYVKFKMRFGLGYFD
jgi:hypothetical protein